MKKTIISFVLSVIAVFGVFICTPNNSVNASEIGTNLTQESKYISYHKVSGFRDVPPKYHLYYSATFKGWLTLEDWYFDGSTWTGIYAGWVYYPDYPDMPY